MKQYEIAQRLKTHERELARGRGIIVKRYEWVVVASGLEWKDAKEQRKALRGAQIYPMRSAAA